MPQKKRPPTNCMMANGRSVSGMPWMIIERPAPAMPRHMARKKPRRWPNVPQNGAAMAPAMPPSEKTRPATKTMFGSGPASLATYVVRTGCRIRMTICTIVPQSSMLRSSGICQGETSPSGSPSAVEAGLATGGSLMMKVKIRKFVKSAAAAGRRSSACRRPRRGRRRAAARRRRQRSGCPASRRGRSRASLAARRAS